MELNDESHLEDDSEEQEPIDPLATILFVVFGGALAYLVLGRTYGFYPWIIFFDIIVFLPTWEAVATFLAILILMFVSLIGGLMRMRYSKIVVGVVTVIAVFAVTYYAMYLIGSLLIPTIP
jgi:hypothetical protein